MPLEVRVAEVRTRRARTAVAALFFTNGAVFANPVSYTHLADPGDSGSTVLNTIGIGGNGPISSMISEVGTSLCPMFVQPGSALASNATQLSGNGGVAPPIAGWVAGMAIQSQCPAFMNALANGNLSMLTGGATPGLPFGLPGAPTPSLGFPGAAPNPLGVPGL